MSVQERQPSIFEKIANNEIPSTKIREDDEFLAILDLFPNTKGQTLLFPKKRYESDIENMPEDVYQRFFLAAKKVETVLKKWLGVNRVGLIVEWLGVNHAHIKLYPMHGLPEQREKNEEHDIIWFDQYPGYLTSKSWDQKSPEYLWDVADEIIGRK